MMLAFVIFRIIKIQNLLKSPQGTYSLTSMGVVAMSIPSECISPTLLTDGSIWRSHVYIRWFGKETTSLVPLLANYLPWKTPSQQKLAAPRSYRRVRKMRSSKYTCTNNTGQEIVTLLIPYHRRC